jgi:hypothetical protein
MMIAQHSRCRQPQIILSEMDLVDSMIEHHWTQFEQAVDAAQQHLVEHDRLLTERRRLTAQVTRQLRSLEPTL